MRVVYSAIFHNLLIKIAALILAVLVWAYIAGQIYMQSPIKEDASSTTVALSDEGIIVKKLPVHVNIIGTPEDKYRVAIERIKVQPAECVVTGPFKDVENLSSVTTEPISVQGAARSIRQKASIKEIAGCKMNKDRNFYVIIPIVKKGLK
ncbi:MAG: hypothetical protein JW946_05820 [Candidatus Omnitrophica bacterium]|nr:hypothetical protein [Candidatus Omnitrophota bacterium]